MAWKRAAVFGSSGGIGAALVSARTVQTDFKVTAWLAPKARPVRPTECHTTSVSPGRIRQRASAASLASSAATVESPWRLAQRLKARPCRSETATTCNVGATGTAPLRRGQIGQNGRFNRETASWPERGPAFWNHSLSSTTTRSPRCRELLAAAALRALLACRGFWSAGETVSTRS